MRDAAVESTTLAKVSYDDARGLLQLEFCSRAVYQYFSVSAAVHQSLLDASSKGRYFNQAIRAELPAGSRITDYISLGVIARFFPVEKIRAVLDETKRASVRERDLPAHVVVYYVIALALYMRSSYREVLRCLLEGVQWLLEPSATVKVAGKSGISQARSRLGSEPLQKLYKAIVVPIAEKQTKGAWYREWRLISLDGSTLDTADTIENEKAFGRPGASRGTSAFPKIRFVALLENGTHVLWAARMDKYQTDEITLAQDVVLALRRGMLCLADRFFPAYKLWRQAAQTGADLLWRTRQNARLDVDQRLHDGSYLSRIYAYAVHAGAAPIHTVLPPCHAESARVHPCTAALKQRCRRPPAPLGPPKTSRIGIWRGNGDQASRVNSR